MAGAFCALALFLLLSASAFADEDYGRLRPASRGSRHESMSSLQAAGALTIPARPAALAVTSVSPPTPTPTPSLGDRIVGLATQSVGARYVFGGASPVTGFDCSGLVQWVLQQLGISIGRNVGSQYNYGDSVPIDQLSPGDLLFFADTYVSGLSHVGIYIGDGEFVDAGTENTGVRRASLADPYWAAHYVGARRMHAG